VTAEALPEAWRDYFRERLTKLSHEKSTH